LSRDHAFAKKLNDIQRDRPETEDGTKTSSAPKSLSEIEGPRWIVEATGAGFRVPGAYWRTRTCVLSRDHVFANELNGI
jgi:hypothetical protein